MAEAQAENDFQDAVRKAKEEEETQGFGDADEGGFGGGFGDGGDSNASGTAPPPAAGGGFAVWGQSGGSGVVIPPFVPRGNRKKNSWDVGRVAKKDADKAILAGNGGDFLIRKAGKEPDRVRHVLAVNDSGKLYEAYIRHTEDGFVFQSREFDTLEAVVKHVQRNPLYNSKGMPLYIDRPCSM